jgi:hypothetical protein
MADQIDQVKRDIKIAATIEGSVVDLHFPDGEAFYSWIKEEVEFWDALSQAAREVGINVPADIFKRERNYYSDLVGKPKNFGNEPEHQPQLEADVARIQAKLSSREVYSFHLPPYGAIRSALKSERASAGIAALAVENPSAFTWRAIADQLSMSAREVAFGLRLAMPIMSSETEIRLAPVKEELAKLRATHDELREKHREAVTHLASLSELEAQYHLKVASASPIKFWKNRESEHRAQATKAWDRFYKSLALAALAYLLSLWFVRHVLAVSDEIQVIAFMVLPTLLAVWALRHLARDFVQHAARRDDAAERATITETYVALASHPGVVPEG